MRHIVLTALLILAPLAAHAEHWLFGVYLDDKRIGEHRFDVLRDEASVRVVSQADFTVKVLMVPVFRYSHAAEETWQDGCLVTIDSRTQVNGKESSLSGRRVNAGFELAMSDERGLRQDTLPECVASFAYWDADTLRSHDRLLNSQTGSYQQVGSNTVPVDASGHELLELKGHDFQIDVSYRDNDWRWVGLSTTTDGGRALHYRLESALPAQALTLSRR
jgi:Family of unknown function (DUF6134)